MPLLPRQGRSGARGAAAAPARLPACPYLEEGEFEGVRLVQPRELQLRLVRTALALHLGAPRQRDIGLLRDQLQKGAGLSGATPESPPAPAENPRRE